MENTTDFGKFFDGNTIVNTKEQFEKITGTTLVAGYNSREDGNETDDENGHFIEYEITPNPVESAEEPLIAVIYENGTVQFAYYGGYYPMLCNTKAEVREMCSFLNPCPVDIARVKRADYEYFVKCVAQETGDDE